MEWMVFLKILQNLQENTCARVSFFNKVAGPRPATLSKKKSGTDVSKCYEFSEISKNTNFYRTPLGDCFWMYVTLKNFVPSYKDKTLVPESHF